MARKKDIKEIPAEKRVYRYELFDLNTIQKNKRANDALRKFWENKVEKISSSQEDIPLEINLGSLKKAEIIEAGYAKGVSSSAEKFYYVSKKSVSHIANWLLGAGLINNSESAEIKRWASFKGQVTGLGRG